jgi:hypothetical protein
MRVCPDISRTARQTCSLEEAAAPGIRPARAGSEVWCFLVAPTAFLNISKPDQRQLDLS